MIPERLSPLVGVVLLRGAGAAAVPRRLPRGSTVHAGRRERHGLGLHPDWVPLDLLALDPVEDGWVATNLALERMVVENDWVQGSAATYLPGAKVMVQRGEHRLLWPGLAHPVGVSISVRTRRLEDARTAYAVDSVVDPRTSPSGSRPGVEDPELSALLRYRLAVLYRHLLEGEPAPPHLMARRAEFLGLSEGALEELVDRCRRRVNAATGADVQSVEELGAFLVTETGTLERADLDP